MQRTSLIILILSLVIEQAPPMEDLDLVQEMSRIKAIFQPLLR